MAYKLREMNIKLRQTVKLTDIATHQFSIHLTVWCCFRFRGRGNYARHNLERNTVGVEDNWG